MVVEIANLDGTYKVKSETSNLSLFQPNADGTTVIKNGLTYRIDGDGCVWRSSFKIVDDNKVEIESTIDPSSSPGNIFIEDAEGKPTRDVVTYKSILDLEIVDGKITLRGTMKHNNKETKLIISQM